MKVLRIENTSRGSVLAERCMHADTFLTRLRGLLGRPPLGQGEALLITPCRAVHMFGMRYSIDVAFLDREGRVVGCETALEPGGRSKWYRAARHALELPAGTLLADGTRVGDAVSFVASRTEASSPHTSRKHARTTQKG